MVLCFPSRFYFTAVRRGFTPCPPGPASTCNMDLQLTWRAPLCQLFATRKQMRLTRHAIVVGITRLSSIAEDGGVLKASDTKGGRVGAVVVDVGPDQHQALQHAERKARTYGKALLGLFSKVDTSKKNKELLALNPDAEAFLKEVFNRLDEDSSGEVTKNALENALNELYDSETAAGLTKLLPNEMKITQEQLATLQSRIEGLQVASIHGGEPAGDGRRRPSSDFNRGPSEKGESGFFGGLLIYC